MDKDEIIGKQIPGIPLKFDGRIVDFPLTMVRNQPVEIALGTDFLSGTGTIIDLHRNKMSIPSLGIEVDLIRPSTLSTNFEKKMAVMKLILSTKSTNEHLIYEKLPSFPLKSRSGG